MKKLFLGALASITFAPLHSVDKQTATTSQINLKSFSVNNKFHLIAGACVTAALMAQITKTLIEEQAPSCVACNAKLNLFTPQNNAILARCNHAIHESCLEKLQAAQGSRVNCPHCKTSIYAYYRGKIAPHNLVLAKHAIDKLAKAERTY